MSHATGREHIEMIFVIVWIDMSIGENWLGRGSNEMRQWQEINLIYEAQVWLSTRDSWDLQCC